VFSGSPDTQDDGTANYGESGTRRLGAERPVSRGPVCRIASAGFPV